LLLRSQWCCWCWMNWWCKRGREVDKWKENWKIDDLDFLILKINKFKFSVIILCKKGCILFHFCYAKSEIQILSLECKVSRKLVLCFEFVNNRKKGWRWWTSLPSWSPRSYICKENIKRVEKTSVVIIALTYVLWGFV
jgi:hypothetical protein